MMNNNYDSAKRVLLINPCKGDGFYNDRIHMGLTLIGQLLVNAKCIVKVLDLSYLKGLGNQANVPGVQEVMREFKPDIIGISVFSYLYDECNKLIDTISMTDAAAVIMLGGPHLAFFPEDFYGDKRISYIVRGEAEKIIVDLVNAAKRQPKPVVVECPLPEADEIPEINLSIVEGSEKLKNYQIQLSRGCPFRCSFCNIDIMAGRRVRARDLETCIQQIVAAKRKYPEINTVTITDDCPSFNKERFKRFLRLFRHNVPGVRLAIDNVRADLIDEEMLELYTAAGGGTICLGVESGHPEVFEYANKGESIERIVESAQLIKKKGMELGLCFVIGLPGDSLAKHRWSIRLARRLNPDYVFWNMCTPWPQTRVHDWFKERGTIANVRNFSTLVDARLRFSVPQAWEVNFNQKDRIKAWLMANMETTSFSLVSSVNVKNFTKNIVRLLGLSVKYRLIGSFLTYCLHFAQIKISAEIRKRFQGAAVRANNPV